jgi:outer membrane protein TolC
MFGLREGTDAAENSSWLMTATRCHANRLDCIGLLLMSLAVGTLSGCASLSRWWENGFKVGPNYTEPQAFISASWDSTNDPSIRGDREPLAAWLTQFNDPALERFQIGVTTELDVQQAKSSVAETEAALPPLDTGLKQAGHRLCILLGSPPGDISTQLESGRIPTAPTKLAVGIPAELLRRRPDVRKAERQVASQGAQIGIAEADLYPSLQLLGFVGYTSNSSGTLFSAPSFTGIIAPVLQWKIFNYDKIKNNVCKQEALLNARITDYQQMVLKAHGEVEDALVGFVNSGKQAARLGESVEAARISVNLVLGLYREGKVDFDRVQNAEAMLVKQQDQFAVANTGSILSLFRVYRGLAGGWEAFCEDSLAAYVTVPVAEPVPPPPTDQAVEP